MISMEFGSGRKAMITGGRLLGLLLGEELGLLLGLSLTRSPLPGSTS